MGSLVPIIAIWVDATPYYRSCRTGGPGSPTSLTLIIYPASVSPRSTIDLFWRSIDLSLPRSIDPRSLRSLLVQVFYPTDLRSVTWFCSTFYRSSQVKYLCSFFCFSVPPTAISPGSAPSHRVDTLSIPELKPRKAITANCPRQSPGSSATTGHDLGNMRSP